MEKLTLGEKIMIYRRRAGLDQNELAVRSGVSRGTIISLEKGTNCYPNETTLKCLADALRVKVEELKGE